MFTTITSATAPAHQGHDGIFYIKSLPLAKCTMTRTGGGRTNPQNATFDIGKDGSSGPTAWGAKFGPPLGPSYYTFTATCTSTTAPTKDTAKTSKPVNVIWPTA
jgi:hypothetical protein